MSKKVSVIIPCYNHENYVSRVLDSILTQTYQNIEVLIINDGSTDNSEKIIKSYISKFKKRNIAFKYFKQENRGVAGALNHGLKYFTGDYLAWMDADDELTPTSFEERVSFLLEHKDYAFVRSGLSVVANGIEKEIPLNYSPKENILEALLFESEPYIYSNGRYLVDAHEWLKSNTDRDINESRIGQNAQMLFPIARDHKCGYIDKPLFKYHVIQGSHSHSATTFEEQLSQLERRRNIREIILTELNLYDRYKKEIDAFYVKKHFALALEYKNRKSIKKYYRELQQANLVTPKERKQYIKVLHPVLSVPSRAANKLKREISKDRMPDMQIPNSICETKLCSGCGACFNVCDHGAVKIIEKNGFKYFSIDKGKCVDCRKCKKACPKNSKKRYVYPLFTYATKNTDDKIRTNSSSGGMFHMFAQEVFADKGLVFGVKLDENLKALHVLARNNRELEPLLKSKYVQSDTGLIYREVKRELEKSKMVMFTGTPCQISGLAAFLGKDYPNLLCVDIVCHGVPSPLIYRKYLDSIEKDHKFRGEQVDFRYKEFGWKKIFIRINGKNFEYKNSSENDLYLQGFLKNLFLRDSCYNCTNKNYNIMSDITIADCWGIEKFKPEFCDDIGVSTVIINTKKGKSFFEKCKKKLICTEIEKEDIEKYNTPIIYSVRPHKKRNLFFKKINSGMEFKQAMKKCGFHSEK